MGTEVVRPHGIVGTRIFRGANTRIGDSKICERNRSENPLTR